MKMKAKLFKDHVAFYLYNTDKIGFKRWTFNFKYGLTYWGKSPF